MDYPHLDFTSPEVGQTELYQKAQSSSQALLDFIAQAPTAWQAIAVLEAKLQAAGFQVFDGAAKTKLKAGSQVYLKKNDSALIAFRLGANCEAGLRIVGAHSDAPALKLKSSSLEQKEGVLRLSTEVYGGPILNTWFDRPLSLAGRVCLRSSQPLEPRQELVDLKLPLLILPNVAIHMNREVNEGVKIEKQNVLLPFLCTAGGEDELGGLLEQLLARELEVDPEQILEYELFTYPVEKPSFCGLNNSFISSARLDNLSMCWAGMEAFLGANSPTSSLQVLFISDNEEVGSGTKQGAASLFARDSIEMIFTAAGGSRSEFLASFDKSFLLSADLAHGVHPNYAAYADSKLRPRLNGGPVLKQAASQAYASDCHSSAVLRQLAEQAQVPLQVFANRSDLRGGSTIGPLSSQLLPLPTVDLGNPIWGMHSARETGGILDQYYMTELLRTFYNA